MFTRIELTNLLSFGPDSGPLELGPLNVLIGPNGSGKSNLIDVIALLRAFPTDFQAATRRMGPRELRWNRAPTSASLKIKANLSDPGGSGRGARYAVELMLESDGQLGISDEHMFISEQSGAVSVGLDRQVAASLGQLQERRKPEHTSILSYGWSGSYPAASLADATLLQLRIYRDWPLGRHVPARLPQPADMPSDSLMEDGSNLGLVLNHIRTTSPPARRRLLTELQELYEGIDDYDVRIVANMVQIFLTEGDHLIPATRISDGTLRYLSLLAVLCHPAPPPLVCIEEPELGLHPDILPRLAKLLVDASSRMQLIVTTHSDILIDALTEHPEAIVVCEKHEGQTRFKRLEAEPLREWLKEYSLGQLWTRGHIGGNRW